MSITKQCATAMLSIMMFAPGADAQTSGGALPVTADNFIRAETDMFFGLSVKDGALGKFNHRRTPMGIDDQFVVRGNRDTLYSVAIFDLDAGPVTIGMPDAGNRFMSLQVIDEDQYVPAVYYGSGSHSFTRERIGTRYLGLAVRTLADPNNPEDIKQAIALQDAITVKQAGPVVSRYPIGIWSARRRYAMLFWFLPPRFRIRVDRSVHEDRSIRCAVSSRPRRHGVAIRQGRSLFERLHQPKMMAARSTSSMSAKCRSMASGLSASTMPKAISKRIPTTPTRSTASRQRRERKIQLPFNSAVAMARSPIACRS